MNRELIKSLILQSMDLNPDESDVLYNSQSMMMHVSDAEILINIVVKECVAVCDEFGEDLENGNILESTEKNLGVCIKKGHLGPILWRTSELIKEKFGIVI